VTLGIGEVEEDTVRGGAVAATGDAAGDADVEAGGVGGGLGFEVRTDGTEGVGGGDGLVEGVALSEEPIAEGGGADGEEAAAVEGGGGDLDEGEAVGGGEGEGVFEHMVEGGEAGGAGERGLVAHGDFVIAGEEGGIGGREGEVIEKEGQDSWAGGVNGKRLVGQTAGWEGEVG